MNFQPPAEKRARLERGERWAEPHPSQPPPMYLGWPPAAQWHPENNQFAGERYVVQAPQYNWYPQVRYSRDPRVADPMYVQCIPIAPPLLPECTNPHPSTEPMRAPALGKGHQPAEDVYSFESFVPEPSATRNIPSAEDFGKAKKAGTAQTASTPADVPVNTPPYLPTFFP